MKVNRHMNRTKLNKTNKTHIYVYIYILLKHGFKSRSGPINTWHMPQKCSKKEHLSNKTRAFCLIVLYVLD